VWGQGVVLGSYCEVFNLESGSIGNTIHKFMECLIHSHDILHTATN
jgi:hypothetical protein